MSAPGIRRVVAVYLTQGTLGLLLMIWMTWRHSGDAADIVHRLGANAPILITILVVFAAALQLLKFELTNVIYVSLGIMAYMTMVPDFDLMPVAEERMQAAIKDRVFRVYQIWLDEYLPEVEAVNQRLLDFDYRGATDAELAEFVEWAVADSGGPLSHCAVMAREYGLPCVTGTAVGTRVIPDGARVTIDGGQGIVRILG